MGFKPPQARQGAELHFDIPGERCHPAVQQKGKKGSFRAMATSAACVFKKKSAAGAFCVGRSSGGVCGCALRAPAGGSAGEAAEESPFLALL